MIYWDHIWLAASLGVLATGLLALRNTLHNLVSRIERDDIFATLKFIVVSAVVLPLLPNERWRKQYNTIRWIIAPPAPAAIYVQPRQIQPVGLT